MQPSCQEIKFVINVSANWRYFQLCMSHIHRSTIIYHNDIWANMAYYMSITWPSHREAEVVWVCVLAFVNMNPLDGFKAGQQCLNFSYTCKHHIFLGRTCGRLAALFVPTETLFTQSQGHLLPCSWWRNLVFLSRPEDIIHVSGIKSCFRPRDILSPVCVTKTGILSHTTMFSLP